MSLVKKLQNGGTVGDIDQFLADKIGTTSFTKDGLVEAKKAAKKFRDLYKSGKLEDAYKFDPVTSEYSVDVEQLPEELKNLEWGGSKDDINKSLLGQYTARADKSVKDEEKGVEKKFNSLAASWMNEFISSKPTSKESTYKVDKVLSSLPEHMIKSTYGGNKQMFADQWKGSDNAQKKQSLIEAAKSNVSKYLEAAGTGSSEANYTDVSKATDLQAKLQDLDVTTEEGWKAFSDATRGMGWDVNSMLTSQVELDAQKEADAAQVKQEAAVKLQNILKDAGISEELTPGLAQKGFSPVSDYSNENMPWLGEFLRKEGVNVVRDKKGREMFLKDGKFYSKDFTSPFSQGYGTQIGYGERGYANILTPESEGWNAASFADPYKEQQVWRRLQGDLPENMQGWEIYGTGKGKDTLGLHRDYGQFIQARKGEGFDPRFFERRDGKYYDVNTGELAPINISRFFPDPQAQPYISSDQMLSIAPENTDAIVPHKYHDNIGSITAELDEVEKSEGRTEDMEKGNRILSSLKYMLTEGSEIEKIQAKALFGRVADLFREGQLVPINRYKRAPEEEGKKETKKIHMPKGYEGMADAYRKAYGFKLGGQVIKAQNGAIIRKGLSPAEYVAKYGRKSFSSEAETTKSKRKPAYGTLRDMDAYDVASIAGIGLSFVPGLGVIGGGITTAADLAKDLEDGHIDDWGTHLMNIGFTALGAVGLGGLGALTKGVSKAGKITKSIDAALDIEKAIAKASKMSKYAGETADIKKIVGSVDELADAANILKKGKGKSFDSLLAKLETKGAVSNAERDALKRMNISLDKMTRPEAADKLKQAVGTVVGIQNSSSNLIKAGAKEILPSLSKLATPKRMQKLGSAAATTYGAAVGLPAVGNIVGNIKEDGLIEGLANTQISDLKGAMAVGALGKRAIRGKRAVSAVKKQATQATPEGGAYKLTYKGGKSVNLAEEVKVPKGRYKVKKGKPTKVYDDVEIETYQADLQKAGVDEATAKTLGTLVKSGKPPKVQKVAETGDWTMKEQPVGDDYLRAAKQYKKAKDVLTGKFKYKEGGDIQKLQAGGIASAEGKGLFSGLGESIKSGLASVDSTAVANAAMYINTLRGNAKAIQQQKEAALAGITRAPRMTKQYIRNTATSAPYADEQATKLTGLTKRIAESTSDLNKGISARLEGEAKAADIRTQAQAQDVARADQIKQMRMDSDRNVQLQNLQADAADMASVAKAQQQIGMLSDNKALADTLATTNLIQGIAANAKIRKGEREKQKLYDLTQGKEYKTASSDYSDAFTKRGAYWQDKYNTSQQGEYTKKSAWSESPEYAQWAAEKEAATTRMTPLLERIRAAKTAYSYGVPIKAKGGSVEKHNQKLELEAYKQTYKTILENNDMMQKALLNVFD